jgi:integrase
VTDSGDFNVQTVEQVEAVARAAADAQDAALYRVAAYTGLRQGELRALRWRPRTEARRGGTFLQVRGRAARRVRPTGCP